MNAEKSRAREAGPLGVWLSYGVGLLILLFIVAALLSEASQSPEDRALRAERRQAERAIEFCDSEYQRLKKDPRMSRGALGIAYGACEHMRSEYRAKFNREP